MGTRGPRLLRQTTNHVLDALLKAAETAYHGQPIGMKSLHDIVEGLKAGAHFDEFYRHAYTEIIDAVEQDKLAQERTNAYGRLMIHPLNEDLQDGRLDRDMLPNVFSFFHLVLGDDAQKYGDQCKEIVVGMKEELGDQFHWDLFYADPQAKRIQWHTLTRIATSFKRWELRKDWFIKLMQYTPTTVSLGQSAFVTREIDHSEEPRVFGNREFCAFFQALFRPLTEMAPADEPAFRKEFGSDPHHLIGHFLVHLATCEV
ncbi:conserved hypothetical protein [Magnetospirillum sp. LM-5]|uniref:hypothetical protein n=1 Tax=Magnetospirillum sp. LM-5 TaxID=2681466 RepID=UPI0013838100|nr:hypothetical protein [Magnetospirillum sp. LM-5]CAA7611573.1 conserved hypothetical protein [Magnetospirillum sp. LM-5]